MASAQIINDLLAQGQDQLTPGLQEKIIHIISGKYFIIISIFYRIKQPSADII